MTTRPEIYTQSKCKGYLTYPPNPNINGIFLLESYQAYYLIEWKDKKLKVYNLKSNLRDEIVKMGGKVNRVKELRTTGKKKVFGLPVQVRKERKKGELVAIIVRVDGDTIGEIDDKIKAITSGVLEYYKIEPTTCMWDKLAPDSTITSGMGISQPPDTPYPIQSESTIGKEGPRRHKKHQQEEDELLNEVIEIAKQRNTQEQIPQELWDRFAYLINKLSQSHHISYADLEKHTGITKSNISQTIKEYQRNIRASRREILVKEEKQRREDEKRLQESKQEERKLIRDVIT